MQLGIAEGLSGRATEHQNEGWPGPKRRNLGAASVAESVCYGRRDGHPLTHCARPSLWCTLLNDPQSVDRIAAWLTARAGRYVPIKWTWKQKWILRLGDVEEQQLFQYSKYSHGEEKRKKRKYSRARWLIATAEKYFLPFNGPFRTVYRWQEKAKDEKSEKR